LISTALEMRKAKETIQRAQTNENLYRLTLRDKDGKRKVCEKWATRLHLVVEDYSGTSELLKVERIDQLTGAVMGGFYNE